MNCIRSLRQLSPAMAALSWLLLAPVAGHAAACAVSAASLKGWYGMLVSGQSTGATPVASFLSGAVLFDGVGTLTGSNIYGSAGSRNSLTGTYAVNADCTVNVATQVGSTKANYTVALKATGEAVGIETDAAAVSTISLKPQYATYTTGLNFTQSSLNGTFAVTCGGFIGAYSDVNLVVYNNGSLTGTDPYNNGGSYTIANYPYTGTYTVNSDGTFAGVATANGLAFDFYGVVTNSNTAVEYFYTNVVNGVSTNAFNACTGSLAPVNTGSAAASQTITFGAIPAQRAGTTLGLTATASSGLPVSYAASPTSVCTVSGSTASLLGPGNCSIVASQSGNCQLRRGHTGDPEFAVTAVAAGSFSLSASASSVTVTPPTCILFFCFGGSSATDKVTVTPLNGFTGPVSFAVAGLPAGVTAAFSPASVTISGSTTLTLTPGSGIASGAKATLNVTGTSGSITASTPVTLTY